MSNPVTPVNAPASPAAKIESAAKVLGDDLITGTEAATGFKKVAAISLLCVVFAVIVYLVF